MIEQIKSVHYERKEAQQFAVEQFGVRNAKKVNAFHRGFPGYAITPLVRLEALAEQLGVARIHVKDESRRFGLNAFKGLGGSYCIGKYIADRLGKDIGELSYEMLSAPETKARLGTLIFVTATDGNHGRGIAWTANILGHKSVVYMPKGSARERLENIRALGADASITEYNYDDAVRFASAAAEKNGWIFVQDTAWPGYERIPGWIMEGYTTMGHEIVEQLDGEAPTHIFLQAGVGAMAGAMTGFFADYYKSTQRPQIVIVEPDQADCIYRTAAAGDGKIHAVAGALDTIMAGLACGEPCTIGWNILRDHGDHFFSVPDVIAAKGMRILGCPLPGDPQVISGESGAVTTGLLAELMENDKLKPLRERLQINKDSRILCISTEGDTDKENYRRILRDGYYPS